MLGFPSPQPFLSGQVEDRRFPTYPTPSSSQNYTGQNLPHVKCPVLSVAEVPAWE